MAVIWTKATRDTHFEVRRAGRSIRLYTNGVFHSQFNPANPISDTVWNLLLLPAFFGPSNRVQRVLVLGVGGGAIVRLLRQFVQPERIVGVELDPTHIEIARRFFGVTPKIAELVEADAVDWLDRYRGPPFDLIVDDLFGEQDGEPVRAVEADKKWLGLLSRNLSDDGVLVMNFIGTRALRAATAELREAMPGRFGGAFHLSLPDYENAVGAFIREPLPARRLRDALRTASAPGVAKLGRLPFRIRRIQ